MQQIQDFVQAQPDILPALVVAGLGLSALVSILALLLVAGGSR